MAKVQKDLEIDYSKFGVSVCKFCHSKNLGLKSLDEHGRCSACCVNSYEDDNGEYVLVYNATDIWNAKTKKGKYGKILDPEIRFDKFYVTDKFKSAKKGKVKKK